MTVEFFADQEPAGSLLERIAALAPDNPFCTPAYSVAMRSLGYKPIALLMRDGANLVAACHAFTKSGRFNKSLEIISLPLVNDPEIFWSGLLDFCRTSRISQLEIGTFGSPPVEIPTLPGESARHKRCEYVLDLTQPELWKTLSSNHQRNVKSGAKAGLTVEQSADEQACCEHARLIGASMSRRKSRGEDVSDEVAAQEFIAYVKSGAGKLFQSKLNGQAVSSLMVMMARSGAYYQSAGTSSEGMKLGASSHLIYSVAEMLKELSINTFNLGGASEDNPGLVRFKSAFGARPVELEAVAAYLGSGVKRKLTTAAKLIRDDPSLFVRTVVGTPDRLFVYTADPSTIRPSITLESAKLVKLSDGAMAELSNSEFREHAERFDSLGFNDAYGVYLNGELVHVSWMMPHHHDSRNSFVRLKSGEVEITHCVTAEKYKGRGIYPLAIQQLCQIAAADGVRRVFMITNQQNVASQRGIEKSGLQRVGSIVRIRLPYPASRVSFTYRGHRWFKNDW